MLAVTCDNASNNDTMVAALGRKVPSFDGERMRGRCFAHILNLIIKSILQQFESKTRGQQVIEEPESESESESESEGESNSEEDPDNSEEDSENNEGGHNKPSGDNDNDGDGSEIDGETHDNDDGWYDERIVMKQKDIDELDKGVEPVRGMLSKVRTHWYISASQTTHLITFTSPPYLIPHSLLTLPCIHHSPLFSYHSFEKLRTP